MTRSYCRACGHAVKVACVNPRCIYYQRIVVRYK